MLYVDYEADSVEAAIKKAVQELDLNENDIITEVLSEGKRGLFGIARKELAKVRIYYKEKNNIDTVLGDIENLIAYLDQNAKLDIRKISDNRYDIVVNSNNVSHFIGKKGKTLKAVQTLVNSFVQKHKKDCSVIVDIDQYNTRREGQFAKWAEIQAREVIKTKRAIIVKSLNAYERRIIHMEISKFDNVETESKGEGRIKNIKIKYTGR
ncbi:hypothetical protein COTS27_00578 [Spirochaetota bacterium]|nr:hypothetical protein COTS27_00578 [Spirochaetota bacterium]